MGRAYKLQCRHCGAQFIFSGDSGYGVMPTCVGCGESEAPVSVVRCPGCQQRLVTSSKEFQEQVIEEMIWD